MRLDFQHISPIIYRHLAGTLREADIITLNTWLDADPEHQQWLKNLETGMEANMLQEQSPQALRQLSEELYQRIQPHIVQDIATTANQKIATRKIVHRVHFLRTAWFRYAAAIVLLITGIAVYYIADKPGAAKDINHVTTTADIPAGSNRAVLTLSDGSKIELDSSAAKTINDGKLMIKNNSGQLIYSEGGATTYNTMSTPNGGQYQLTLSDGTRVWLNAASSITYTTAFTGKTREVSISGEAYFEVKTNKSQPFIVKTSSDIITVLGTSFNINSYKDEGSVKTSLIDGVIKVGDTNIKPGQSYQHGKVKQANTSQDIAWVKGEFNFEDLTAEQALRQIARWYDLQIIYEKKVPDIRFFGSVSRSVSLTTVLKVLNTSGITFTLRGKKLIVH
jgi:transmembrane sensor